MKILEYKAAERGSADYGWLQANYSFSFANYFNPERSNFGALRVLNDDFIQGGMGFGRHPHDNMEIITIPLQGALAHKDSMSETWQPLQTGEVQVMSAGTGIMHAEKNNSTTDLLNLFQIWIIPDEMEVKPAYDQMRFEQAERKDKLQTLVTSYQDTHLNSLKIHQDVVISRIDLSQQNTFTYTLKSENHGVYVMLISGAITIAGKSLHQRDALAISETNDFELLANEDAEILFIEIPMKF